MPYFPFGLEKEAEIYYMSALHALSVDPQVPEVTQGMAEHMKSSGFQYKSTTEVISDIVRWTKEYIRAQGTTDEDENSVAWSIALLVKSYELLCSPKVISFKEVYKSCFKRYYGG